MKLRWFVTAALLAMLPSWVAVAGPNEDDAAIRAAKTGLGWFVLANVDRPTRVSAPCPLLSPDAVATHLAALNLVPNAGPYGTAIVFDDRIGGGIVAVRCGNDLSVSGDPPDSVGWSMDVAMLDGQATFNQLAVRIGGRDVLIDDVAELDGTIASKCSDGGRTCTVAFGTHDLAFVLRLEHLPEDTGEQLARQLIVAVAPETIANLAAVGRS